MRQLGQRDDRTDEHPPRQLAVAAPTPSRSATSRAKRALDLGIIVLAAPVILPVAAVISILVAVTSRGPVLFTQERVGLDGQMFKMFKFRTMHPQAEQLLRNDPGLWAEYVSNGFKIPAELDCRVTVIGRFLRRSSLDELPQVLNVLIGTMSLVGPRPIVPAELENYGAHRAEYLALKPGVTGLWQVNGRSDIGYPERVRLDCEYGREWSLWADVVILARTPLAVLSARGAF